MSTTKITNAVATYQSNISQGAKEQPEDVSAIIHNIDPASSPLVSLAGSRSCNNSLFEWMTEELAAISTAVAVEGFAVQNQASTLTTRQNNVVQLMTRNSTTTGTEEKVTLYGKRSQRAHQMAKIGRELKRDLDASFMLNNARNLGNDTTARVSGTPLSFIKDNINKASDGANPTGDGSNARTDGTARAFTQAQVNDVMQQCYSNGAEPTTILCGPLTKQKFSTFGGRQIAREIIDANQAGADVQVFTSDFGNLRIVPTRHIRSSVLSTGSTGREMDVLLVQPDKIKIAYLRNFTTFRAAKTGDADTDVLLVEAGVEVSAPKAHGLITDLDPTIA